MLKWGQNVKKQTISLVFRRNKGIFIRTKVPIWVLRTDEVTIGVFFLYVLLFYFPDVGE